MRIRNSLVSLVFLSLATFLLASVMVLYTSPKHVYAVDSHGVRILESDTQSIVLDLEVPSYTIDTIKIRGQTCERVSITGYGLGARPGEPELPQRVLLLGIPPDAETSLEVLATQTTVVGGFDICPAPQRSIEPLDIGRELLEQVPDFQLEFVKNPSIYVADAFFPSAIAEIGESGYLRDQRYVQVLLHPVQYNPITGELKHHHYIKLQVDSSYPQGRLSLTDDRVDSSAFEPVLQDSILNYETAKVWRASPPLEAQARNALLDYLSEPTYKIAIAQDGIYQLTYGDLETVGLPVDSLDPRTFQLFNMGSEVAIYVEGEGDGTFGSSDYILFYGQKMNTKYTDTNVYWLTYGKATGLRMAEKDGSPLGATVPAEFKTTSHVEENHTYWSGVPVGEDRWFWEWVSASGACTSATFTTTLSNIAVDYLTATVRVSFIGGHDSDHHTKVYLNDQVNPIEDAIWDGKSLHQADVDIPQSYLNEGVNTIKLEVCDDLGVGYDSVCLNWFEIEYHDTYTAEADSLRFSGDEAGTWEYHVDGFTTNDIEAFDITDPANVSRIINTTVEPSSSYTLKFEDTITDRREYLALTTAQRSSPTSIVQDAPSDLHSTSNGADYVIITHSDFYTDVLPLASRRAAQGLRTMIVDVQNIYDEFSYGIFDPEAIRDFVAYSYTSWAVPAPSYMLLVGDGNLDFKDYKGTGEPNYIPPYLANVDPFVGETATDNRFVTVSGGDLLADMHIGRLPVQTSAQATTVVNKILNYEQNPTSGDWNEEVLFVADNADAAGDFASFSDDIVDNYLPPSYSAQKVYYKITHSTAGSVKTAIINAINEGCFLTNYIGHAAVPYWAHEKFFEIGDFALLTNHEKLPMMLPMTCLEGYFHSPAFPCFGESIVRAEGKGAIASWSSAGFGLATGHDYLNKGFFTAVFTDNISEIGTATYLGKLNLYTETGGEASPFRDLMDTYVLFGDPFMKLNLPACDAADYDNDGRITVGDVMQVAAHWDTQWGDANFDRKYDLDDDGDVDIVDVMWVAGRWEEVC